MSSATTSYSFTMYMFKLHWVLLTKSSATTSYTFQASQCHMFTSSYTRVLTYNELTITTSYNVHFKLHWVLLTMSFTMFTSVTQGSSSQCTVQVTLGPSLQRSYTGASLATSFTMYTSSYTGSCLQ